MIAWWKAKVAEIMPLIPSFRGFLAKADSEGQPGPMKFNRTEADGANLFGSVLNPLPGLGEGNLPGVAIWRSFSHPDSSSPPPMNDQAYFQYLRPFNIIENGRSSNFRQFSFRIEPFQRSTSLNLTGTRTNLNGAGTRGLLALTGSFSTTSSSNLRMALLTFK